MRSIERGVAWNARWRPGRDEAPDPVHSPTGRAMASADTIGAHQRFALSSRHVTRRPGRHWAEAAHSVTVPRPLVVVNEHIADLTHVAAVLPAVRGCTRLDTGEPGVGSCWRVRIGGRRLCVEVEWVLTRRRPHWVTFTAGHAGVRFTLDYACVDLDLEHATEVHASLQYESTGPVGLSRWLIAGQLEAAIRAATGELLTRPIPAP